VALVEVPTSLIVLSNNTLSAALLV